MKRVGIVGIGFMGWIHYLAWQQIQNFEVAAICSTDPAKRSGDWTGIQGNFGPPGQQIDLSGVSVYQNLNDILQDETLDLIDICLPPGLHASAVTQALNSGKNVLCEKPMALTSQQCQVMLDAMKHSGQTLMVAHVLPFFPEYAYVYQLAKSKTFGSLQGGEFKRTVSDPTWVNGFYDPDIVGGPLIDLHVHDAHFIRALFGMPAAVTSVGRWRDSSVEYCASIFDYPDDNLVVSSHGGVVRQQGRPFTHAFEIRFEQATAQFEFAAFSDEAESMPLKIITNDGQIIRPNLGDNDPVDAFVNELKEVVRVVIGSDKEPSLLDAEYAADAIRLCHAQTESIRQRSTVRLD